MTNNWTKILLYQSFLIYIEAIAIIIPLWPLLAVAVPVYLRLVVIATVRRFCANWCVSVLPELVGNGALGIVMPNQIIIQTFVLVCVLRVISIVGICLDRITFPTTVVVAYLPISCPTPFERVIRKMATSLEYHIPSLLLGHIIWENVIITTFLTIGRDGCRLQITEGGI